jgi:formylglycine-generating enzyme required for sulfatase activity
MIGNVWEWVSETVFDGSLYDRELPSEGYVSEVDENGIPTKTSPDADENYFSDHFWVDKTGTRGMFRGGFWGVGPEGGQYAIHAISPPSFVGIAVGFRCAK